MADGGGDDGDDNPFSFKNFIHIQDKNSAPARNNEMDGNTEDNDIFSGNEDLVLPENSPPVAASSSSQTTTGGASALLPVQLEEQPKPKKKTSDGNPFSFKKFLAHSGPKTRWQTGLAGDLPDFVQDHYNGDLSRDLRNTRDLELPDFTLTGSSRNNEANGSDNLDIHPACRERSSVALPDVRAWNEPNNNPLDSDDIFSHNAEINGVAPQLASSLPDFLSDGACGDVNRHPPITVQVNPGREVTALEVNGDLELELRRLRDENREIRRQLAEAQQLATTQANRVNQVLKEMESTQTREKDETEALEKMVQQVEANLEITTQRATKAESTVSKLKQDVKLLQKQLQVTQSENEVLRSGDAGMMHLRQQTLSASEQLSVAASSAEQSLRQLLGGVDTLRILSAVLSSTDKIAEEGCDNNQKGDNT